jgi:hypothetical protein
VEPVERVDRHHVAVDEEIDRRIVVAGDVVRRLDLEEIGIAEVGDERDDLAARAGEIARRERPDLLEEGVGAVPRRRRAEGGRHLRKDVPVELVREVARLCVGDRVTRAVVATVGSREAQVVGDPDLDPLTDGAEGEELGCRVAGGEVDHRPDLLRPHGRALLGGRGRDGGMGLRRHDDGEVLLRLGLRELDTVRRPAAALLLALLSGERRRRRDECDRRDAERRQFDPQHAVPSRVVARTPHGPSGLTVAQGSVGANALSGELSKGYSCGLAILR